jgi:hypothetical protein
VPLGTSIHVDGKNDMTSDAGAPDPTSPGTGAEPDGSVTADAGKNETGKAGTGKPDTGETQIGETDTGHVPAHAAADDADAAPASDHTPTHALRHSDHATSDADGADAEGDAAEGDAAEGDAAPSGKAPSGDLSRPPEMLLGAGFLTLAALPLLLAGLLFGLMLGPTEGNLRRQVLESGKSVSPDTVITLARVGGLVVFLIAVVYIALAWFALKPRRSARAIASGFAVLEVLLLVAAMFFVGPDPVSLGLILLSGAGIVLLYLPRSEEFILTAR